MKKLKYLILLVIILVGAFLRIYKIDTYLNFSGELGDNLLQVRTLISNNQFPLQGPPTSHPWLYFSPLYYWMLIPVEGFLNYDPLGPVYLGELLGIGLILVNYLTIRKFFDEKVALIASFLMAISPLWVSFSRDSRFYFWLVLFFYPLFYLFVRIKRDKKSYDLLLGLIWGLMLGFHYSPVIFLPLIIFCLKKPLRFLIGLVFTFIPLLLYDSGQKFYMFKNLVLWFPYRVAGFLHLYPKNNVDVGSILTSLQSFTQVVGPTVILTVIISIGLTFLYIKNSKDYRYIFIFYSTLIMILAAIIHGGSPIHYFLPIFPIPIIVTAILLDSLNSRKGGWIFQVIILVLLSLGSVFNFKNKILVDGGIPYPTQVATAKYIVRDANGRPFILNRIGPGDYFPEEYSQNYQYLLWYFGNRPQNGKELKYTIIEYSTTNLMIIKS
jgi:hypothetical protein